MVFSASVGSPQRRFAPPLENTFFTLIDRSKAEDADQRAETCISSHICVVYMNAKGTKIKYILLEIYMFCVKVF